MQLIKPSEISGKIMTLIDEAKSFVHIISPYYKVSDWIKLKGVLDRAQKRGVIIRFWARQDALSGIQDLLEIGYAPELIPNLHAKLYFNEETCIITSMNLYQTSDENSLDIGIATDNADEYEEVLNFYENYILPNSIGGIISEEEFLERLADVLQVFFNNRKPRITWENDTELKISGKNLYTVYLFSEKKVNRLALNCVLSRREYEALRRNSELLKLGVEFEFSVYGGKSGYYDMLYANVEDINFFNRNSITEPLSNKLIDTIIQFVGNVESFKSGV